MSNTPMGNRGYIGIKKEVTWGAKEAGVNDFHLPFLSETLTGNIEEVISAIQRGILDEPKSYQGERSFGGDVVIEVHPASFGHILRSAINEQYPATPDPADTAVAELEDCEDKWDELIDGGVISGVDANWFKKGTKSVKLQVTTGVSLDTILATEVVALTDMHLDTHIKLWIKSSVDCAEGDLVFMISEVAECGGIEGTTLKSVDIPVLVAGVEKECTIALGTMTNFDAVISLGIKMHTDKGEFTINIDDVRRLVTTDASDAKQHIFTPRQTDDFSADCPINPYTLEVYRDQGQAFQFLGAIVNTLALSFSTTDKILKATCGIIAKDLADTDKTVKALETTNPFTWEQAVIKIANSPNYDIDTFGINWDNKCVAKYALNNTAIPRKIIRSGFREIPVSFTMDFVNRTEYEIFKVGTEQAIQVKFVGAACEENGNTYYYTLQIDIPKFRYLTYPINIGGPGPIVCGVTGKAKYDATAGVLYPIKFTLINTETGY